MHKIQIARHRAHFTGFNHRDLRIITLFAAQTAMAEPYLIAGFELRYRLTHFAHNPGTIATEHRRQGIFEEHAATANLGINGIDPGSMQLHLDLRRRGQSRLRNLLYAQIVDTTRCNQHDSFHN